MQNLNIEPNKNDNSYFIDGKPFGVGIIAKWIPEFGKTFDSAKNIDSQWITMNIITRDDFFNQIENVTNTMNFYKKNYNGNKDHIKLALIEPIQLETKETIAIDYTYHICLMQRLWRKKYYSQK
jgi:hypothetical protein